MPPRNNYDRVFNRSVKDLKLIMQDGTAIRFENAVATLIKAAENLEYNTRIARVNFNEILNIHFPNAGDISLAISEWIKEIANAGSIIGDDYEFGDEYDCQDTAPMSFDELMGVVSEAK